MGEFRDNATVLVVDDSPESLGMINMALDEAGMTVLIALNGQQALQVLERVTPDVILLDAVMPVMDGFECAQAIRRRQPLTPIIFMTGLSDVEHIVRAFDVGGNDYIVKPIRPEELLVRIRQHAQSARMLLDTQRLLDSLRQHVFCIDRKGRVLWATPEAQALLDRYAASAGGPTDLVERLSRWLPSGRSGHDLALPLQGQAEVLTVQYFKQTEDDEYLLKIQSPNVEIDPAVLEEGLAVTSREAEVLLWLAHGKTNREIADILKMSPRTVNKHLEQIYQKIDVDNRTAAASLAIQVILGGRIGRPRGP